MEDRRKPYSIMVEDTDAGEMRFTIKKPQLVRNTTIAQLEEEIAFHEKNLADTIDSSGARIAELNNILEQAKALKLAAEAGGS